MSHSSSKTHIVIPARYASSRLPGKPLLDIHGKPMILWVAQKAHQANFADDVYIATDNSDIADVCQQAGYEVVMTRADHVSGTDRLCEVAQINGWHDDDIVINMQGDEPLVPPTLLKQVKDGLLAHPECVMATLCEPILTEAEFVRPSVVKVVMNKAGHALYFSRAMIPCDREHAMQMFEYNQQCNQHKNHPDPTDTSFISRKTNLIMSHETSRKKLDRSTIQPALAFRHLGIYAYRVKLLKSFVTWDLGMLEQLECLEQLRVLENGEKIAVELASVALPAGVDTQADLDRLNALPEDIFIHG